VSSTVLFASEDGQISVRVRLGGVPAVISDGYARWTLVDRDGLKSITDFAGVQPYAQTVPVFFDGWRGTIADSSSVESDIRLLERLAVVPDGATQPPIVRVTGNVRRPDLRYVIQGPIVWSDVAPAEFLADPTTGERYRQVGTVTLLEFQADELLNGDGEPKDAKGRRVKTTKVRRGEHTLRDVAKRVYGTRTRARDLARLNDLPLSGRLKTNQRLLLPA
jgi:hypothetical protein